MRFLPVLLILISDVLAEDEIRVDHTDDAVIVRSAADQANFLFRVPAAFEEQKPETGFQVDLKAADARIRLRITTVSIGDAKKTVEQLARDRHGEDVSYTGDRSRGVAKAGTRVVLLVRDGTRLYELVVDDPKSAQGAAFNDLIEGFAELGARYASRFFARNKISFDSTKSLGRFSVESSEKSRNITQSDRRLSFWKLLKSFLKW